ncbi:MAG: radical SAM protein [Candidatus Saelkia tenebricola]|nr:radical SAM protein [Candidatus Saelkia tenebricola]
MFRNIDKRFDTNFCKPIIVLLYLTNACNSNCKYCSLTHEKTFDELTTKELKKIILELKKWLGIFYLNLCGGEPFLRDDIFEIIKFANNIDIITDITTNCSLLDEIKIKNIIDSRLSKIILSLEGIQQETHDTLRQKGQFERVMFAVKSLKNKNINITLNTVINSYNLKELPELVKFTHENRLNGIRFVEVRTEFIKNEKIKDEVWPKEKDTIDNIINELVNLKKQGYPILNSLQNLELIRKYFLSSELDFKNIYCNIPYDQLCISANGEILPCFLANDIYPHSLGNLKLNTPRDIWESPPYVESRFSRKYCKKNCMMGEGYLSNENIFSNLSRFRMAFTKNILKQNYNAGSKNHTS